MRAGCYTLDLYCDNRSDPEAKCHRDPFPKVFLHERGAVCRRKARRAGWLLGRDQDLCPKCSGKAPQAPYRNVRRTNRPGLHVACKTCGAADCACDPPHWRVLPKQTQGVSIGSRRSICTT